MASVTKPEKPHPDFPLFPHATRRWAKKIKGKLHYFGPWDDPDGALAKYHEFLADDGHSNGGGASRQGTRPKPGKPYPDFPLFAHDNGQWAKTIPGKLHYFGPWVDPQKALTQYLEQRDDRQAGRKPRVRGNELTVKALATKFMNSKRLLRENGELSSQMHHDYLVVCREVVRALGKDTPVTEFRCEDFAKPRKRLDAPMARRCTIRK